MQNGGIALCSLAELRIDILWTLKLGIHKNISEIKRALNLVHCCPSPRVQEVIDGVTLTNIAMEIDLVALTTEEFGFNGIAKYQDICKRAGSLGLKYCPDETGLLLRKKYQDQPRGEWLRAATKVGIEADQGNNGLFKLGKIPSSDELLLGYDTCLPDTEWPVGSIFVFVVPRPNCSLPQI